MKDLRAPSRPAQPDPLGDDPQSIRVPEPAAKSAHAKRAKPAQSGYIALLEDIDAALERLDTGNYGWCQSCGAPISLDQLERDPAQACCETCN